jgi:FHA domain-containing protein
LGFLKHIEKRMESLVEGVFGRAFRRQIHPVEIAKGLTKQMDEGRMVSISRTYAPNDFTVHLSKEDTESIRAYQASLNDELIQYASTHAENKNYHLMTPPRIRFETEDTLRFGEFGVTAKLTGGDGPREKGAPQDTSGQTRIFRTEEASGGEIDQGTATISADEARRHGLAREIVEVVLGDEKHQLEGRGPWSVGRSQENDIVIHDPNVSRRHARISRADNGFVVEDLGSTNGTLLDGAPIDRERIEGGDELTFGQSTARFIRRIDSPGEESGGRR